MDANKENERKTSNIPLLIRSLPKAGRPLSKTQRCTKENKTRDPLKTLSFQCVNLAGPSHTANKLQETAKKSIASYGSSKSAQKDLSKQTQNIKQDLTEDNKTQEKKDDSKLKLRQGTMTKLATSSKEQNVSSSYLHRPTNTVTTLFLNTDSAGSNQTRKPSNESNTVNKQLGNILKDKLLGVALMPTTSFVTPPLEVRTVKKVKNSLKRPHSRGLQSLPPFEIDLKKDAVRCLNFNETVVDASDYHRDTIIDDLTQCYTGDALKYLLSIEKKPRGSNISESHRSCMFNYIMQVNSSGGNPAVAQSACWYLDSCVVDLPTTIDQLKLLASACFWISSKYHGGAVHGMKVVRGARFAFTVKDLNVAEKNIMRDLNFPVQPVAPHEFVPYLSWWCDVNNPGMIQAAADFLCQCGLTVCKPLGQEYASVVAAAAVRTALKLLKMDLELNKLEECPVYKAAKKKATDMSATCVALLESVQKMVSVDYEYKSALFHFSNAPYYIAPKIMCAAHFVDMK